MHHSFKRQVGFTIVELLVVIVVIGILAALALVSYTGISQKAIVASMQTDLSSSASKLKMYYTDNGKYPAQMSGSSDSFCPTPADARYCLKASSGNIYSYSSTSPYSTFSLTVTHDDTSYRTTENNSPVLVPPPIIAIGGVITTGGGNRTHTFNSSESVTVKTSGSINIEISGAGGGGNGGGNGGTSSVTYSGTTYTANGGLGNGTAGGTNSPSGWTATVGGGGAGGLGAYISQGYTYCDGEIHSNGCYNEADNYSSGDWWAWADTSYYTASGGTGGKLAKTSFAVTSGQTITVSVGSGGNGVGGGANGNAGIVTITYAY